MIGVSRLQIVTDKHNGASRNHRAFNILIEIGVWSG